MNKIFSNTYIGQRDKMRVNFKSKSAKVLSGSRILFKFKSKKLLDFYRKGKYEGKISWLSFTWNELRERRYILNNSILITTILLVNSKFCQILNTNIHRFSWKLRWRTFSFQNCNLFCFNFCMSVKNNLFSWTLIKLVLITFIFFQ